jgi:hypothetical protein
MQYEITGNWYGDDFPSSGLIVNEPEISADQAKTFHQTLRLLPGEYTVSFQYDSKADRMPGRAMGLDSQKEWDTFLFEGFLIDGICFSLQFVKDPEEDSLCRGEVTFIHPVRPEGMINDPESVSTQSHTNAKSVSFSLSLSNTRVMRTWIDVGLHRSESGQDDMLCRSSRYYGMSPDGPGEFLYVRNIPFHLSAHKEIFTRPGFLKDDLPNGRDSAPIRPFDLQNEYGTVLDCGDIPAKTLHFLGMVHNIDYAHGAWYNTRGDEGYSHFAGDLAGNIEILWSDGTSTDIPLIFGYNLWYCAPWDMVWHYQSNPYRPGGPATNFDSKLFCGDDSYRKILHNCISLTDGVRNMGACTWNSRFIFSVDTQGRAIRSLRIAANPSMYDFPIISAITAETDSKGKSLTSSPHGDFAPLPDLSAGSLSLPGVSLASIERCEYLKPLSDLMHVLYTFTDERPVLDQPEIPSGYFGPEYDMRGSQLANYTATYLYYNGPESAAHIADSGTGCSSSTAKWALNHYTFGTGIWIERKAMYNGLPDFFIRYAEGTPGHFPGGKNAWTRGVGELVREAVCFGYDKYVEGYLDWLDDCLFNEASPPHWNRIAGVKENHITRKVGEQDEVGNRENDGHGICMWGRYMAWHKSGRPQTLPEKRMKATRAAADWILWQLDTDTLYPGIRKDVLFTDSECAHDTYEIYSSYNCLHGIRLTIRQLRILGDPDHTYLRKLEILENRLANGILDHLTEDSFYGKIWFTEYKTDWQDHAHKLVHLQLASEGITLTPLEDYAVSGGYDAKFLEIDINSYEYLMNQNSANKESTDNKVARMENSHRQRLFEKLGITPHTEQELAGQSRFHYLRMYGYGQGMITQAALLLDRMEDATRFVEMLVNHCYLPKFGRFISPEGIVLHKSHKYYLPVNGYMGQDSHLADSTKAIRLMIGADDNNPDCLRLVPRFPSEFEQIEIRSFPIVTRSGKGTLSYHYIRTMTGHQLQFDLTGEIDETQVRFGPFTSDQSFDKALFNGEIVPFERITSGDSVWVWVKNLEPEDKKNTLILSF